MPQVDKGNDGRDWLRPAAWGGSIVLVVAPLLVLKLADRSSWDFSDLPFALILAAGAGLAFEAAVRVPRAYCYGAGALMALGASLLLLWMNLAVGIVGPEDDPFNLVYFGVVAIALIGALLAGLAARGMAIAMAAAALAQVAAAVAAALAGSFTGPLTIFFTGLWLASAWLFRRASVVGPSADAAPAFVDSGLNDAGGKRKIAAESSQ